MTAQNEQFRMQARVRRLASAGAVLALLVSSAPAVADEPFPGPRIGRPYEEPPRMLATAQNPPKSAAQKQKIQSPRVIRKPQGKPATSDSSVPSDKPYSPQSIHEVEVDIAPKPADPSVDLPMIHYPPEEIASLDPIHFTSRPMFLTQLDGGQIDQRLSGPVAPFCFLPTYFEDESLTRFGYSHGHHIQPLLSATQFYVSVPLLPYFMQKRHPWDPVCPNYMPPPLTFSEKAEQFCRGVTVEAVAVEAACIATTFLLVP